MRYWHAFGFLFVALFGGMTCDDPTPTPYEPDSDPAIYPVAPGERGMKLENPPATADHNYFLVIFSHPDGDEFFGISADCRLKYGLANTRTEVWEAARSVLSGRKPRGGDPAMRRISHPDDWYVKGCGNLESLIHHAPIWKPA